MRTGDWSGPRDGEMNWGCEWTGDLPIPPERMPYGPPEVHDEGCTLLEGGRNYRDHEHVCAVLDEVHAATPIALVVTGAAAGADLLGEEWAKMREVDYRGFPAKWRRERKKAGPLRNQVMCRYLARLAQDGWAVRCVAFPGGAGTADMMGRCGRAGVGVRRG